MAESPAEMQTGVCDATVELERVLAAHPFTRGLSLDYLRLIAGCGTISRLPAGHYLWRQGENNTKAYLVLEGEVALEITIPHDGKVSFETIGAGELVGCPGLFHAARWGFDGRAVTTVRVVVLDARSLHAAIERDHGLGYQLLERCAHSLGKRLTANRLKLAEAHSAVLS